MPESIYLVTVGVNEEAAQIRSKSIFGRMVCDGHIRLDYIDREATACVITKDALRQRYSITVTYWIHRGKPTD